MEPDINLQEFGGLFPKDILLLETNKKLKDHLSYGELLWWIGIWVLTAIVDVLDQQSFWEMRGQHVQ